MVFAVFVVVAYAPGVLTLPSSLSMNPIGNDDPNDARIMLPSALIEGTPDIVNPSLDQRPAAAGINSFTLLYCSVFIA